MATLEITTKIGCRNNCSYCPQDRLIGAFARRRDHAYLARAKNSDIFLMRPSIFKQCIDRVPRRVDIHFTGMCEPWLNPDCTQMLLYAQKRGHRIAASTTLVGMAPADIDALAKIPFKVFWIHLPSAQGGEAIRVDDAYLANLERIMKSPIPIRCHYHGQSVHPALKDLPFHGHRQMLSSRSGNARVVNWFAPGYRNSGTITCARNLRCNVLLPSGEVVLCCNDYGMQHVLGNLLTDRYEDLFRSAEFIKVQKGLSDPTVEILCRYCDVDVLENRRQLTMQKAS